ncbi:DUF3253 domain-containing protein [Mucilaginibacter corticis]|uniref:DUF3253 domain-containing protein n=1 Tax=Mucilaginibacter corticis TaxID=2597670 RepID=A0A556MWX3_9SPHI|nr:DUF3253 domain-containing protein [Mucilaginibacter corticis]TSJ44421.1 DUF3253 domain-containing protein [Mucilaginibacter corticis]
MNITQSILQTARERGTSKSTCPSEIARALFPDDWRKHMGEIRDAAIELHKSGQVLLTQKGNPVDPDHIKGPVRIRISRSTCTS